MIKIFGPATNRHDGPRILFLDGAESHIKVSFIDACLERGIFCLILPAHLSHIFQPLDVHFFGELKRNYHQKMEEYVFGIKIRARVTKGMFFGWHQEAWQSTVDSRVIRAGWRDSGLWPLRKEIMCPKDVTPERQIIPELVKAPYTIPTHQHNLRLIRRGIPSETVMEKLVKAHESSMANEKLLIQEIECHGEALRLYKTTTKSKKRARYSQGKFFDPVTRLIDVEELDSRKVDEEAARKKRHKEAQATAHQTAPTAPSVVNEPLAASP